MEKIETPRRNWIRGMKFRQSFRLGNMTKVSKNDPLNPNMAIKLSKSDKVRGGAFPGNGG